MPDDETMYTSKIAKQLVSRIEQLFYERGEEPTPTCKHLGLSHSFVSNARKHAPRADRLFILADHFGVSTDYLLGRTDSMAAPARSAEDPTLMALLEAYDQLNEEGQAMLLGDAQILIGRGYIKTHSSGMVEDET